MSHDKLNKTNAFESETNRMADFWIAYVLNTYQTNPSPGSNNGDYDPDGGGEWGAQGINGGGTSLMRGSIIFYESTIDYGRQMSLTNNQVETLLRRHVVHEIAHQFGIGDGTGGIMTYSDSFNLSINPRFTPNNLNIIRSRVNSPGQ